MLHIVKCENRCQQVPCCDISQSTALVWCSLWCTYVVLRILKYSLGLNSKGGLSSMPGSLYPGFWLPSLSQVWTVSLIQTLLVAQVLKPTFISDPGFQSLLSQKCRRCKNGLKQRLLSNVLVMFTFRVWVHLKLI